MKNLNFKYISAKNFLCFGPEGIEINFSNYKNIVLIRGNNLDVKEVEDKIASNGVGKSSIPEIIVYAIFGKTIKHPKKITHKDVINNQSGKNLKVEVILGDFKIVRTRKPDSLRIWEDKNHKWKDDTEITLGGMPATQKLIEDKIGLNYETFVNILVFTDNNAGSFLECDASNKRQIVENLLSLDKYRDIAEKAKDLKKNKKDETKNISFEVDSLLSQEEKFTERLNSTNQQEDQWKSQKNKEILEVQNKIKFLQSEIIEKNEDVSLYLQAQKEIENAQSENVDLENEKTKIEEILNEAKDKLSNKNKLKNSIEIKIDNVNNEIEKILKQTSECEKEIKKFKDNKDSKCKFCFGKILEENYKSYIDKIKEKILDFNKELENKNQEKAKFDEEKSILLKDIEKLNKGINLGKNKYDQILKKINEKRNKIKELSSIKKPKDSSDQLVIEEKINNLQEQINYKNKELKESPFASILISLQEDIENNKVLIKDKKEKLLNLEKELPYYDFWVTAFGDSGIRKFIIDGIIPALNSRIAYWLQYLIDGKIKLEFNNELEEKIERQPVDGDPFIYHAMSGGERRRLNLAVSQAFAYIMSLSSGVCPSLVFLDEVTTNIDTIGVIGVYNMILELSKDRQVFITTHDQNLLDLLEGCELINLEKRKGFTKLK